MCVLAFCSSHMVNSPVSICLQAMKVESSSLLLGTSWFSVSSLGECFLGHFQSSCGHWSCAFVQVFLGWLFAECHRFPHCFLLLLSSTYWNLHNVFFNTCPHVITLGHIICSLSSVVHKGLSCHCVHSCRPFALSSLSQCASLSSSGSLYSSSSALFAPCPSSCSALLLLNSSI